jgi:hypothetical protein
MGGVQDLLSGSPSLPFSTQYHAESPGQMSTLRFFCLLCKRSPVTQLYTFHCPRAWAEEVGARSSQGLLISELARLQPSWETLISSMI